VACMSLGSCTVSIFSCPASATLAGQAPNFFFRLFGLLTLTLCTCYFTIINFNINLSLLTQTCHRPMSDKCCFFFLTIKCVVNLSTGLNSQNLQTNEKGDIQVGERWVGWPYLGSVLVLNWYRTNVRFSRND